LVAKGSWALNGGLPLHEPLARLLSQGETRTRSTPSWRTGRHDEATLVTRARGRPDHRSAQVHLRRARRHAGTRTAAV